MYNRISDNPQMKIFDEIDMMACMGCAKCGRRVVSFPEHGRPSASGVVVFKDDSPVAIMCVICMSGFDGKKHGRQNPRRN